MESKTVRKVSIEMIHIKIMHGIESKNSDSTDGNRMMMITNRSKVTKSEQQAKQNRLPKKV